MTKHEQILLLNVMTNLPYVTDNAILNAMECIQVLAMDLVHELKRRTVTGEDDHGRERQGADG